MQIWDWKKAQQIGEFETILDFGGRRLLLASDGSICVTGSWRRGLAAYSLPDGACLRKRPELVQIQLLTWSASGREVNCGFEKRSLAVIDARTGNTLSTMKNALRVFSSRYSSSELVQERERYRLVGEYTFEIPAMSFGILDAAFSSDAVCISEPKTGIRCIKLDSGEQLWHHSDLWSNHLAFCASDHNFYGAVMMNTPPHNCSLVRLAPKLVDCAPVAFVGLCWEAAFSDSGNFFVTRRGDVYATSNGRLLSELDFPQGDYPDR